MRDWASEQNIQNYETTSVQFETRTNSEFIKLERKNIYLKYNLSKLREIVSNLRILAWSSLDRNELINRIQLVCKKPKMLCYGTKYIRELTKRLRI